MLDNIKLKSYNIIMFQTIKNFSNRWFPLLSIIIVYLIISTTYQKTQKKLINDYEQTHNNIYLLITIILFMVAVFFKLFNYLIN